jgi:hypothetical protein
MSLLTRVVRLEKSLNVGIDDLFESYLKALRNEPMTEADTVIFKKYLKNLGDI